MTTEDPAQPAPIRQGLLTYATNTGASCVILPGPTQVSLGRHQTLFAAYQAAREDGHRPSHWASRAGGVELRIDQADHWDRIFDEGQS